MEFKNEMPILQTDSVHFLHCGISSLTRRAIDAMTLYGQEIQSDPIGTFGPRIARVDRVRQQAAQLLGTESSNIAFTKSTTHGLLVMAHSMKWNPGDVVIVEEKTFPANWYTWTELEARYGIRVMGWPERNNRYEIEDLEILLQKYNVRLVSISAADYGTGFCHDVNAVGKVVKKHGVSFGIDGIQAVGCVPVNVTECQADFLSADGHKWMLGPEGAGILYVAPEFMKQLDGAFSGWIGRENFMDLENRNLKPEDGARRFEEGALNFAGVLALGGSLELINEVGIDEVWNLAWRNRELIRQWGTELGMHCVSPLEKDSSIGTVSFDLKKDGCLKGDADDIVKKAESEKVWISQRKKLLRFAPHFYQSEALVKEGLARIEKFITSP